MIQSNESAERIRELLDRNLQEVFGEGGGVPLLPNSGQRMVSSTYHRVPSSGTMRSTSSLAISGRRTPTMSTHRMASRRCSTMPGAWPGVPALVMRRLNILAGM